MDDDEIKAKLQAMWTPELWDRIKADVLAELEASPQYKDRPEERNAKLESIMQRARWSRIVLVRTTPSAALAHDVRKLIDLEITSGGQLAPPKPMHVAQWRCLDQR